MHVLLKLLLIILLLSGSFLFLLLGVPYLKFKSLSSNEANKDPSFQVVAHRGAAGLAPENTMASFEKALELGVDMIELDVHLTRDGKVVVIHDSNLSRTTGFNAEVEDLTIQEIRSHDAGSWFDDSFQGQRIPTLDQVLKKVAGQCRVLIEIKWPQEGIYDGIARAIFTSIDRYEAYGWTIIQSFEPRYLHQINALRPETETHQLLYGASNLLPVYVDRSLHWRYFEPLPFVDAVTLNVRWLSVGAAWKSDRFKLGTYTVNDIEDMIRVQTSGASLLITDRPDLAIDLFH